MIHSEPSFQEIPDRFTLAIDVEIRLCRQSDLRALEWFGQFTPHRRIIRDTFRRHKDGTTIMLVADMRDAAVGQVWLDTPTAETPGLGRIWALRVFPWFCGLGFGTRLTEYGENLLRERGAQRIEITVDRGNDQALRLYERLGYSVVGSVYDVFRYRSPSGLHRSVLLDQWVLQKVFVTHPVRTGQFVVRENLEFSP